MISQLLELGQVLNQLLVVILSGRGGGLVIVLNRRVRVGDEGGYPTIFILAWGLSICGMYSCAMTAKSVAFQRREPFTARMTCRHTRTGDAPVLGDEQGIAYIVTVT